MLLTSRLLFELRIFSRIRMRNTKLFLRLVMRFRTSEGALYTEEKFLRTKRDNFKAVAIIEAKAEPGSHRPKSETWLCITSKHHFVSKARLNRPLNGPLFNNSESKSGSTELFDLDWPLLT